MESDPENWNPIMNRRRSRRQDEGEVFLNGPLKKTGGQWGFLIAGALILAVVAFFSGVQLGKNLRDLNLGKRPFHQGQAEVQMEIPFRMSSKGAETAPVSEPPSSPPEGGKRTGEPPLSSPSGGTKAAVEKPAGGSSTTAKGTPSSQEEKKAPLPAKGKFTLQIAAFNNNEEALDLVQYLKRKGYPAYQMTGSAAAKGTLHRVRIGQFASLEEARQFALDFEKKERMKTIITGAQSQ
jgi:cell division protein FtsN